MPDVAMHYTFGMEVRDALPAEIRDGLTEDPYVFALYGPDFWFMYKPWERRHGRGRRMHTTKTGAFLCALAEQAKNGSDPEDCFSYLAGFLCHYALDSFTHPYIVWQSTETWPTKEAHRDMEHALDVNLMKREGYWGEKHPVTDHHYPKVRLPKRMSADLDAVYGKIYGWKHVRRSMNRCVRMYRQLYRFMEKPRGLAALLATLFPSDGMRSVSYAKSAFLDRDVENLRPGTRPTRGRRAPTRASPSCMRRRRRRRSA